MSETSILSYNILLGLCCKRKLWDNSGFLIKIGEFLAELIGKIFGEGQGREERNISFFKFGRLPEKKGKETYMKKLMAHNIYGNPATKIICISSVGTPQLSNFPFHHFLCKNNYMAHNWETSLLMPPGFPFCVFSLPHFSTCIQVAAVP